MQTQWQWAWTGTLNANNCWFFFVFPHFNSVLQHRFAFSLSSRMIRSQIWARVLMIAMHRDGIAMDVLPVLPVLTHTHNFQAKKCSGKNGQWFLQQRWQHDIKLVQLISLAIITHLSGSRKRSTDGRGHTQERLGLHSMCRNFLL